MTWRFKKDTFVSRSNPDKKRTLEQLFRAKGVMDVIAIGNREPNPANKVVMPFSAQFAEVEVNTKTGEVKVVQTGGRRRQRTRGQSQDLRKPGVWRHAPGPWIWS